MDFDFHRISLEELCGRFQTHKELGLTNETAKEYLDRDGPNTLTPPPQTSEIVKFLKTLFGGFAILLWIGAFLSFFSYIIESSTQDNVAMDNVYLGVVLSFVVIVTGRRSL